MRLYLPDKRLLQTTGDVDYYHWNYKFPIKYIQRFRFKAILKLMGNTNYDKLLEVGTGSGIFLPELARHCSELHAIDIHDRMGAVKTLCELLSVRVNIQRCNIENTGFPDNFFDAIVAISVFEFVKDLTKAIHEVRRILKPNGVLLSICPRESALLDFVLGLCTRRSPTEEFGISRTRVFRELEAQFDVVHKKIFPFIIGSFFPVYNYYKLTP